MSERDWSLGNRLGRWIVLFTVAPVLLVLLVCEVFLHASVAREVEALVREEVEEARVRLLPSGDPIVDFEAVSRALGGQHGIVSMGWWMLDRRNGKVVRTYGDQRTLDRLEPLQTEPDVIADLPDSRNALSLDLTDRYALTLVLDGSYFTGFLRDFRLLALAMLLAYSVLCVVGGRWCARRISGLLRRVAEDVGIRHRSSSRPRAEGMALPREISRIARSLECSLSDIERKSEEYRVLTAGLAHELRSPVQNLMSQAEVALLGTCSEEDNERIFRSQLEELGEFANALDNLLTLCANARPTMQAPERFDIASETRLRLKRERPRAQRCGVRLSVEQSGDTIVSGDREALMRGVRNVVTNAMEFSPKDGEVAVRIQGHADEVVVTVDDTGPGIGSSDHARLFEPFVRGAHRPGQRIGYGLGLAMTKRAMESHGGHVEVGTSPAGGARFRLHIPRDSSGNGDPANPARG